MERRGTFKKCFKNTFGLHFGPPKVPRPLHKREVDHFPTHSVCVAYSVFMLDFAFPAPAFDPIPPPPGSSETGAPGFPLPLDWEPFLLKWGVTEKHGLTVNMSSRQQKESRVSVYRGINSVPE